MHRYAWARVTRTVILIIAVSLAARSQTALADPNPLFPWDAHYEWYFTGGPHAWGSALGSGLDFAPGSSTAVLAVEGGTVVYVGWNDWGYGNNLNVRLDHGDGWQTWYLHLSRATVSTETGYVAKGAQIGVVGSTGASAVHIQIEPGLAH